MSLRITPCSQQRAERGGGGGGSFYPEIITLFADSYNSKFLLTMVRNAFTFEPARLMALLSPPQMATPQMTSSSTGGEGTGPCQGSIKSSCRSSPSLTTNSSPRTWSFPQVRPRARLLTCGRDTSCEPDTLKHALAMSFCCGESSGQIRSDLFLSLCLLQVRTPVCP